MGQQIKINIVGTVHRVLPVLFSVYECILIEASLITWCKHIISISIWGFLTVNRLTQPVQGLISCHNVQKIFSMSMPATVCQPYCR